jgi:hypothetical protein
MGEWIDRWFADEEVRAPGGFRLVSIVTSPRCCPAPE